MTQPDGGLLFFKLVTLIHYNIMNIKYIIHLYHHGHRGYR